MPRVCAALLLLLPPTLLRGHEVSTVREGEFLAMVTRDHPAAVVLAGDRDRAAAEAVRAALLSNPAIEVSREEPDGVARETSAGLTWTPPLDGRRALRREAAVAGLAAAEQRLASSRLRLRLEVRAAYAGWALAWQRRELAAAHLARVAELADRARARAEAGEVSGLAARRFRLEQAQARADLGRAEAGLAAARAAVAAFHPALAEHARPVVPPLPEVPATLPELGTRPDLAALERQVESTEALRGLAQRVVEAPALGLAWKRVEEGPLEASGPVVSVGWTLPLFDRRQADRLEAETRLATARAELELARARAEAERDGALAAYARLRSEAENVDRSATDVEGLLAGAAAAYQLGESGLTDLLDALRTALAVRATALEIQQAALTAHRALEAAAGRPLTSDPGGLP